MIATRFRSVVWTGGICAAALSFYLVSQTVAAKRAELASVERQIDATGREIRSLETEIGTRAGMAQIENWNARVYGLQAPGALQFVNSSVQLVAMTRPAPLPLDPAIAGARQAVQLASLEQPATGAASAQDAAMPPPPPRVADAAPPPAPEQPMIRAATFVRPNVQALAPATSAVREASLTRPIGPAAVRALADRASNDAPAIDRAPVDHVPSARSAAGKPAPAGMVRTAAARPAPAHASADGAAKTMVRLAALDSMVVARATAPQAVAKPSPSKTVAKRASKPTSLDDAWLADITGPARKARP